MKYAAEGLNQSELASIWPQLSSVIFHWPSYNAANESVWSHCNDRLFFRTLSFEHSNLLQPWWFLPITLSVKVFDTLSISYLKLPELYLVKLFPSLLFKHFLFLRVCVLAWNSGGKTFLLNYSIKNNIYFPEFLLKF